MQLTVHLTSLLVTMVNVSMILVGVTTCLTVMMLVMNQNVQMKMVSINLNYYVIIYIGMKAIMSQRISARVA